MGGGCCRVEIFWPAISGDGNKIAEKCGDTECCAAEIFSDLLLLQKPAPRVWWYQESPSLEFWGRGYNQTLSWIKNQKLQSLVIMTWGIPDKYHRMSVVNMAEIVMIRLMILTPTFVLLQGGVSHCSTAACWDPWWWWDEEIWFKTSHKGSGPGPAGGRGGGRC